MTGNRQITKRSKEPQQLKVVTDTKGDPVSLDRNGRRQRVVAVYEKWRLEDEWWGKEEKRWYYKIQTSHGLVCDIYHELVADLWYMARIYD